MLIEVMAMGAEVMDAEVLAMGAEVMDADRGDGHGC